MLLLIVLLQSCVIVNSKIPKGVNRKTILIKSEPTTARIYLNDEYLGKTPLKTKLWYEKEKFVNIKAEPVYPNQFAQNLFFKIPPIPPKLVIYMDYQARKKHSYEKEKKVYKIKEEVKKDVKKIKTVTEEIPAVLPVIYFETDKFNIESTEAEKIDFVTKLLQSYGDYKLSIHAHADERGSAEYNRELSQNRAQAVKDEFIKRGISGSRLEIFIHGEQITWDEDKQQVELHYNRAVDFRFSK